MSVHGRPLSFATCCSLALPPRGPSMTTTTTLLSLAGASQQAVAMRHHAKHWPWISVPFGMSPSCLTVVALHVVSCAMWHLPV